MRLAMASGTESTEDGFTLVEVVVALGLIALAFSALSASVLAGSVATRTNEARSKAQQLASSCLESAMAASWTSLSVGDSSCAGRPGYTASRHVEMRNGTAYDDKLIRVSVAYTYANKARTVVLTALRAPRVDEVAPPSHTTGVTTAAISLTPSPSASPASVQLASNGALASGQTISLRATTNVAADLVTVSFGTVTGAQTISLNPDATFKIWTLTIDSASPFQFNAAAPETYTFGATAGNAAPASATATNTLVGYSAPASVTLSTSAAPSNMQLDTNHYLTASGVTLQATTSAAVSSVTVSYAVNGTTITRSLLDQGGGISWKLVLQPGSASGVFAAGTDIFTFTATTASGGTVSQAQSIGFSYPLGVISVGTYVVGGAPNGHLCTDTNGAHANKLHFAQTLTFTITNGGTAPVVSVTWVNPNGSASSVSGPTQNADGTATYVASIPINTTFTGSSAAFTVTVKRSDGAQNNDPSFSAGIFATNRSSSCA